jgi:hypothetical protein
MNILDIENQVMKQVIETIEALDLDEFTKDKVIHAIARGDDN